MMPIGARLKKAALLATGTPATHIIDMSTSGLLKKPDRLQRSLFQRLKPDKLASIRAIDDC
jgi:hypothetical protein